KEAILNCGCEGVIRGILHTENDRIADVVEDQGTTILYGEPEFTETLLGLNFRISPFSFFQTNSAGAEVLYDTAREYLNSSGTKPKTIYDLYSGTGTISQLLSPAAERVVGVEIIPEAVEAARESARDNGITNCEFIAGDVLQVLDDLTDAPEVIVLDPPRDGVHPKALRKILSYGAKSIIYIACRPASLARDYEVFRHFGYEIKRMSATDMYPFTRHLEVIALLEKS
ncbi:MAG: methyltransferase domain-containing protein, partial [Lachnospiraceae bacterium]|nr:methyltransferase domain-containing protein [Lachnospiraceae bacterium]